MSQVEANALTAEIVAEYLRDNPDFFLQRRELVDRLSLPNHQQGAVSLVEVQLKRQRQRIEELEEEITTLMSLAANNDRTFYEFMELQEQILQCDNIAQVVKAIKLKAKDLGLKAYVRLLNQEVPELRLSPELNLSKEGWARFSTNHLNGKDAYLGRLRKADREALLGEHSGPELGSYVVLPLVKQSSLGALAFSSEDGGHFQPHMDTLFLRHLALVVAHLIETLTWPENDERIQHTSSF
ncbi:MULTISPECIES: DUF484 family protein [Vibrio]|uniref:3',5'-cyclic-nucleotide phosphodiesterase n=2 Tax=Vibrio TaxID=662 RepID=A0A1E5CMI1_9VIBR|nr:MULTISPECIES: DUF484 family protein [Vibrio]MDN3696666.1 DUF484 family protein [Vibrio cortegadensis]OEE70821.1 3',5'-cyclic-nucleotide phosphodiesterase [Vibrio genomosp. F6 str. FF-238]RBW64455.1 DUF484 family protein [Vibrionales bacterium C3R12]